MALMEAPALTGEVVVEPTLEELAETANREHRAVEQSMKDAIEHVIASGEALLAARILCPHGTWRKWLDQNFQGGHNGCAYSYMKIAHYKDIVRGNDIDGTRQAIIFLRGLAGPFTEATGGRYAPKVQEEARALRAAGASRNEIARLLGVAPTTVAYWTDPKARARQLEHMANRRVIEREKSRQARTVSREKDVTAQGGDVAKAYTLTRRALQAAQAAHEQHPNKEMRAAAALAMDELYRALDILWEASTGNNRTNRPRRPKK